MLIQRPNCTKQIKQSNETDGDRMKNMVKKYIQIIEREEKQTKGVYLEMRKEPRNSTKRKRKQISDNSGGRYVVKAENNKLMEIDFKK